MTHSNVFRDLHRGPELLLLPNCWDAASAKLLAQGARAIATTSAGMAWSNGCADGGALPVERLLAGVRSIARVIDIPLSVDVEGGYSDDPVAVGQLVRALVDAGAVGVNLEDGTSPPALLAEKIACVKEVAPQVFVNARIDVYIRALAAEAERVRETIARAALYERAGADGIFVPKILAGREIGEIAASTRLPLNVLAWPGLPPLDALASLGVRRVSTGAALALVAYAQAAAASRAFLAEHHPDALFEGGLAAARMNALFARA